MANSNNDFVMPFLVATAAVGAIAVGGARASSGSASTGGTGMTTDESGWVSTAPLAQNPPYRGPGQLVAVGHNGPGGVVRYQTFVAAPGSGSGSGGANSGRGNSGSGGSNAGSGSRNNTGASTNLRGRSGNPVTSTTDFQSSSSPAAGQTVTWDVAYEGAALQFDPRGIYQMGIRAHTTTWQGANIIGRSDTTRNYSGRYIRHGDKLILLNGVADKAPLLARAKMDTGGALLVQIPTRTGVTGGPANLTFHSRGRQRGGDTLAQKAALAHPTTSAVAPPRAGQASLDSDSAKAMSGKPVAAQPRAGLFGWLSSKKARAHP